MKLDDSLTPQPPSWQPQPDIPGDGFHSLKGEIPLNDLTVLAFQDAVVDIGGDDTPSTKRPAIDEARLALQLPGLFISSATFLRSVTDEGA
jgi:hypothetical protein